MADRMKGTAFSTWKEFRMAVLRQQYRTRAGTVRILSKKDLAAHPTSVKVTNERMKLAFRVFRSLYSPDLPFEIRRIERDFAGVFSKQNIKLKIDETLWPELLVGDIQQADFLVRSEAMEILDSSRWWTRKVDYKLFGVVSLVNHTCEQRGLRWSLKASVPMEISVGQEIRVCYSRDSATLFKESGCNCPKCLPQQ